METMMASHLAQRATALENARFEIAEAWIRMSSVNAVFVNQHISGTKFATGYGVPIVEYFIAVVKGERDPGDCPVMSKLVYYLLEKQITPKDIFDICMGFRRAMIGFLFEHDLVGDDAAALMDEIAELFDTNLSGVLDIFGKSYARQQKQLQEASGRQKKFKQILQIINSVNTKIVMVEEGRIVLANKPFLRITGATDLQDFYHKYPDGWSFTKHVDTDLEHFDAEHIQRWLETVYKRDKPFKLQIYHHTIGKDFTYSGRVTALPDSDPQRYVITLNNIDTHLADEAEAIERLRHDELTNLWSYAWFEHLLGEARREAKHKGRALALAVIDIPDLEQINEKKGYDAGDRVLTEVAADIGSRAEASMLTARLEGSRFGVLMVCTKPQACYDWCVALQQLMMQKPERKIVALTPFDCDETVNRLLLRAYELVEAAIGTKEGSKRVQTDMEGIVRRDILPDQQAFTDTIGRCKSVDTTLFFQELPINGHSKIVRHTDEEVTITLPPKQLAAAHEDATIFLELPGTGEVKAKILQMDSEAMEARVGHFMKTSHSPLERKWFRIRAPDGMMLHVIHGEKEFDGLVIDMNERYIAFKLPQRYALESGNSVALSMLLEHDEGIEKLTTYATVERIEKLKESYKVVALCHLHKEELALLTQYIAQRQMEIIKTLRKREY